MKIDIDAVRGLAKALDIPVDDLIFPLRDTLLGAYLQSKGLLPEKTAPGTFLPREIDGKKVRVDLDMATGEVKILVTEFNEAGEEIGEADDTPKDFTLAASAAVRRLLGDRLQRQQQSATATDLGENLYELVSGVVQQGSDPRMVFVDLGKVEAKMPPAEQVPTETYKHGQRLKVLLVAVQEVGGNKQVVVSRTHPGLVRALFALEVPEVADGTVEIVALAREAGSRSKMAVLSNNPLVAAKGACIGPKGARVDAVVAELNGEKVDIIDYSEDPAKFVGAALAPASVVRVDIIDEAARAARVFVPDYQLSLAIGKEGQNARLAARLTGWRIDIRSDADPLLHAEPAPAAEAAPNPDPAPSAGEEG